MNAATNFVPNKGVIYSIFPDVARSCRKYTKAPAHSKRKCHAHLRYVFSCQFPELRGKICRLTLNLVNSAQLSLLNFRNLEGSYKLCSSLQERGLSSKNKKNENFNITSDYVDNKSVRIEKKAFNKPQTELTEKHNWVFKNQHLNHSPAANRKLNYEKDYGIEINLNAPVVETECGPERTNQTFKGRSNPDQSVVGEPIKKENNNVITETNDNLNSKITEDEIRLRASEEIISDSNPKTIKEEYAYNVDERINSDKMINSDKIINKDSGQRTIDVPVGSSIKPSLRQDTGKSQNENKKNGGNETHRTSNTYDIATHNKFFERDINGYFLNMFEEPYYSKSIEENVDGAPLGPHTLHLNEMLIIPSYEHSELLDEERQLVATIFISGHMQDHVDTTSYFLRYCAQYAKIFCSPIISMPDKVKRWKIHKSPFVNVKSKESFEYRLYTRAVQLYNADTRSTDSVINFVKLRLPRAVNMKIVYFDYQTFDEINKMYNDLIKQQPHLEHLIRTRKEPFEYQVEVRSKELINEWNKELKSRLN